MKKITILIACVIIIGGSLRAQAPPPNRIGHYVWSQSVLLTPCAKNGTTDNNGESLISEPGQKFVVIGTTATDAVIEIVRYNDATQRAKYNFKGNGNKSYFKAALADLDQCAVKDNHISGALALGVINFPFKYRPQKGLADFSGSFNFGAAIGYKFAHSSVSKWNYSLVTTYSISNINLDSVSVSQNQDKLTSSNNFAAFSFSVGALIEYDKVQAGVFIGWDNLSRVNQLTYGWKYQGKPWISVGFGYSIFSSGSTTDSKSQSQ